MTFATIARVAAVLVLGGTTAAAVRAQTPASAPVMVFAASDLGPPLKQIVQAYERTTGGAVTLVFGSTGMLTQQIRNGAPADVFFAANESFINDLTAENLTLRHTRVLYARGRVATATLKSAGIRVESLADLADPRFRRIAIANPQHAPYGLAARQALEAAGLWKTLEPRLVFGENVQQAVQFVRSGSAQAGLVARSVVETPDLDWKLVDERLHAPLNQMAVVLARTKHVDASTAFLAFVNGSMARAVMRRFGFLLPGEVF
jgi:molybdate transport system substrate-binding protein